MPPFFTPTAIVYKILFFLKRFLVAAADNVPPHKLSSLSYPPPLHFSQENRIFGSRPHVQIFGVFGGYRWRGQWAGRGKEGDVDGVSLPVPPVQWSTLSDVLEGVGTGTGMG